MLRPRVVLTLALFCSWSVLHAAQEALPVDAVRPGMVGVGQTVFDGTRVEPFTAHILGVIDNVIGTRRHLILAKLDGGPLARTGVIAGMSGSPVYVDGRLIGAVSYSLGSFPTEPIAGITPIDEMVDAANPDVATRPVGARVAFSTPEQPALLLPALAEALARTVTPVSAESDAHAARLLGVDAPAVGLRPIGTPLVVSGGWGALPDQLTAALRGGGFTAAQGASPQTPRGEMPFEGPLKPGDAVGVAFVQGDLRLGATGTVTHVDGTRVYAFGHPMYNLGPIAFPMTRAYVYTLLPSLSSSSKLAGAGDVIGTFLQDRATAIAGRLGAGPSMVPVSVTVSSARGGPRPFRFEVVRDQMFGPLMLYTALVDTLQSYERQFGIATFRVRGRIEVAGHDSVALDSMYAGEGASSAAAAYAVAPVTALVNNDVDAATVARVELTFDATEAPVAATIDRVWLDDPRPRAGDTTSVHVLLRPYRGEEQVVTVPITVPAVARGGLVLQVTDGGRLAALEQREARLPQSRSATQMIRTMNAARRAHTVYVRWLATDTGAVVLGERLPALPPSVLSVVDGDRAAGLSAGLSTTTLGEWSAPVDAVVSGQRAIAVSLRPR